jgi:RNA 2',3'-cyclic 3'-phosphodiesterase
MMSTMRLFVSIEPPDDAVEHLDDFLGVRRSSGPELRWSPPGQWHLTLAFMGSAPDRVVDEVVDAVAGVASRSSPMGLAVVGGGCFPDVTRAKVLWAGVGGSVGSGGSADVPEALGRLARGVRSACSVAGAAPEGGPFVPHLTLGRFSRAEDATRWMRVLSTYTGPPWVASDVAVVASHLPRDRGHRARHEVLARLPLGG